MNQRFVFRSAACTATSDMSGMNNIDDMKRRSFLKGTAALAMGFSFTGRAIAADVKCRAAGCSTGRLIASAPVLQNAAETTMGVGFAVSADASGWVEISNSPDMVGAKRVYSGGLGMMEVNGKVALVRVRGLKPATRYWYRVGADRISYESGYKMKNLGSEVDEKVHSFTTLGASAETASFCVINDTHEKKPAIDAIFSKLAELKPGVVVWNGDASNCSETIDAAIRVFMHPHEAHPDYAADTPFMFVNGNHDVRGRFNRHRENVMMFRAASERDSRFAELGRNFVQRLGPVALIGMDTGEDKSDRHPVFAGIFQMERYRSLQTQWLAEVLESPSVKSARFKILFCHIPLIGPVWWEAQAAKEWVPLIEKAGVQLVCAGHHHRFRHDAPTPGRPWTELIGGGYGVSPRAGDFPTVIEGRVAGGRLVVTVHDVISDRIVFKKDFV